MKQQRDELMMIKSKMLLWMIGRQEKAKWTNAAAKTELRGKRGAANADMTLVYTGNCRSSLVRNKVPFRVSGVVNGQEVSGCCRSVQVR